jgi:hypothetical protein
VVNKKDRERVEREYPRQSRVEFVEFAPDPPGQTPEPSRLRLRKGTQGTVSMVDSIGTVHVDWDDGSHLGMLVLHGDKIRKVK